ncbi:hypothetical protein [Nocardia sp. NPDC058497]|uniref:hypothetical protein n=1 Tax=Nocardia sp. NPDC058497 TaxID=3346529 RepID=UPI0036539722
MSTHDYDVYLDGVIISGPLDQALDAFDAALAELSTTIGLVAEITAHATGARIRFTDSTTTHYLIAPHDAGDRAAWAMLVQTRLQRHWPTATFALRPVGRWSDTEFLRLSWTDGPTPSQVIVFLGQYQVHPFTALERDLDRVHSTTAWATLAALVETTASIEVPRTAAGDIDWAAAATVTPGVSPANIAGLVFDTAAAPTLTLAEILRELSRHVDLTHITTDTDAQITAPTLTVTHAHAVSPVSATLPDGTAAVVVGYLAVEDRTPPAPGTPVAPAGPQPGTDSTALAMALVEVGEWETLVVAADGTVTRGIPGDGGSSTTRWVLYPVDRNPDTGGYILTRRPVTAIEETVATSAAILDGFSQSRIHKTQPTRP